MQLRDVAGGKGIDLIVSEAASIAFDREYVRRKGLYGFLRLSWNIVEPAEEFIDNWHIEELANHCQAVTEGRMTRLVINIPPGTMKSLTVSVNWHPWTWIQDPGKKFIFISYDPSLARRDARRSLNILLSDWYRNRWPHVRLLSESPAEGDYSNLSGGFRYSSSVRGRVTGRHAHIQVVDDPIKPADTMGAAAATKVQMEFVKTWWKGTMSSRMSDQRKGARLIVMQRLAEDDLAGHVLSGSDGEKYEHLCLPMRHVLEKHCRTSIGGDRRTEDGELLFPARFPEDVVTRLEHELGVWSEAQLQQEPTIPGGQIFRKDWFKYWTEASLPPVFDRLVWSWDCAFKETPKSDYVCGQLWGQCGPDFYLLARIHDRLSFQATMQAIAHGHANFRKWGMPRETLIEEKANGAAIISVLQEHLSGIIAINPEGGKESRANAVSYLFRAGNVYHPDPTMQGFSWVHEHEGELVKFPRAKFDDSVDATTQVLLYLTQTDPGIWSALSAWMKR